MKNEITLYGTVGASFWDEDYFTSAQVRDMLEGREGPLTVRLNSGGGIATEGQAIYTALKDYPGEVHVVVDGVAASAASLIAMAGDKITMRLGAWMLIHDPAQLWGDGRGTADDHRELAAFLDKIGDAYAQVYAARTGRDAEAMREIMRSETVYLGAEAVAEGFATNFEGQQAAAAASFDYRIYAHAPEAARQASSGLCASKDQMAVLAAIAGFPRPKEVPSMADPKKPAAETPAVENLNPAPAPNVEMKTEGQMADPKETPKPEKPVMSAVQASTLHELAAKLRVPGSVVTSAIQAGVDFEGALAKINEASVAASDPQEIVMHGRPTARILRDERETRGEAMVEALHSQLSPASQPTDRARAFMGHSIVEMAAECVGYNGPLRTAGDRLRALEMASHSTSDFPAIFENALNKTLLEQYQAQQPTYRAVARRKDFADFRPHPMVRPGDFPALQEVTEGGEIKWGTFGESKETAQLASYAIGLTVTRQMLINDEMGAISQVLADYGNMVAAFEEKTFYAFLASATLADGQVVFRTQRNNKASSGAALSVDTLAAGRAAILKQTSIGGNGIALMPSVLLVGPNYLTAAEQLTSAIQPVEAGKVNPFAGKLSPVVTAQITGNAWYLFADPNAAGGAVFTYGFLNGAAAPRIRTEEPFWRQGMSMTVEHDFGLGAIDYRGGWMNAGA